MGSTRPKALPKSLAQEPYRGGLEASTGAPSLQRDSSAVLTSAMFHDPPLLLLTVCPDDGVLFTTCVTGSHMLSQVGSHVPLLCQVTTAKTRRELALGHSYFAHWHVDNHGSSGRHNFHWILLMVAKEGEAGASRNHGNLCVVSTSDVDTCDAPGARQHWMRRDTTSSSSYHNQMLDQLQCCPSLDPGDAVFYREDVAHRTQDEMVDRLTMVIKTDTHVPPIPTPEDVRCAEWASEGECTKHAEFMQCVCKRVCAAAAYLGETKDEL